MCIRNTEEEPRLNQKQKLLFLLGKSAGSLTEAEQGLPVSPGETRGQDLDADAASVSGAGRRRDEKEATVAGRPDSRPVVAEESCLKFIHWSTVSS